MKQNITKMNIKMFIDVWLDKVNINHDPEV